VREISPDAPAAELLQRRRVAPHDGLSRCLECRGLGVTVRERIEVRGEGRPAKKP